MKYAAAIVAGAIALVGAAVAQTTTAPALPVPAAAPAVPPSPSSCPAYPPVPIIPDAAAVKNTKQLNAGTETVNSYIAAYQQVHNCRVAEIDRLKAQVEARIAEARAGQAGALDLRNRWQTVGEAVTAKGAPKRDTRTGRQ